MAYNSLLKSKIRITCIITCIIWTSLRVSGNQQATQATVSVPADVWEGQEAVLNCTLDVTKDDVALLFWYKHSQGGDNTVYVYHDPSDTRAYHYLKDRAVGRWVDKTHQLIINKAKLADEDTYICKCATGIDSKQLTVKLKPEGIAITDLDKPVTENTVVEVTCKVTQVKPEADIYWRKGLHGSLKTGTKKNGLNSGQTTFHLQSTYKVSFSRSDHNTQLYCLVTRPGKSSDVWGSSNKVVNVLYPPSTRVTQKSPTGSPTEGQSVTLTCDITDGRPKDDIKKVKWKKDGQNVTSSDRVNLSGRDLTIRSLDHSKDDGSYICAVENAAGMGEFGDAHQLEINYKPTISIESPAPAVEGQLLTITCQSQGARPAVNKVTWKKSQDVISGFRYTGGTVHTPSLTILKTTRTDAGQYTCQLDNDVGHDIKTVTLQVWYRPNTQVIQKGSGSPTEGQSVTLTCDITDGRPRDDIKKVMWKKGGQEVTSSGGRDLTISSLDHSKDDGSYTCAAENAAGMGPFGDAHQLHVFYRPLGQATTDRTSVTVAVGGQVSLTCSAPAQPGYPVASWFYWRRQNSTFTSNTTVLTLTPSQVEESGRYSCVAGNWLGQSDNSDWTTVTVQAPAKVENPRMNNIRRSPAFDDQDFKMTCTVSGSGDLKVQWHKDGKSIVTSDFVVTNVLKTGGQYKYGQAEAKDSTLMWQVTKRARYFTCNNITHFDGHYTCAVSTQTAGATTHDESKAFIVTVQYKAHWTGGPTVVAAAVDDRAVDIVCSVCANPQPQLTWTFNNKSLREGINVANNRITLDVVKIDDFGSYECTASNNINGEHRNVIFPIELVTSGPPKKPLEFTVLSNHTSVALTLRWRQGFNGGYPPLVFILQYGSSDKSLTTMDKISTANYVTWYQASVIGLQPETEYVFILHAENKRPQDKGTNKSPTVRQTGSTTAAPQVNIASVSVKEDHMTVTWTYKGNSLRRRRRSTSRNVSVVIHYEEDGGDEKRYPPEGTVAAETKEVTIHESFDIQAKYSVWLTVYEGQLAASSQRTQPFEARAKGAVFVYSYFCLFNQT